MDLVYGFLKVASMIATGIFGALGLLTKYKDDQGQITRWGKVALGGILLSSCLSLGLFILETSKARASAEKAEADATAMTQVLQSILSNAQITANQQKQSLDEINLLKADLTKTLDQQQLNLKRTDEVAEGMKTSINAQHAVLGGNKKILTGLTGSVIKLDNLASNLTRTNNELVITREGLTEQIGINLMTVLAKGEPIKKGSFTLSVIGSANETRDQASYLFSDVFKRYGREVKGEISVNIPIGFRRFRFENDKDGKFRKLMTASESETPPDKPLQMPEALPIKDKFGRDEFGQPRKISHVNIPFEKDGPAENPAIAFRDLKKGSRVGAMNLEFSRSISRPELEHVLQYWLENFNLGNIYLPIDEVSTLAIHADITIGERQITSNGISIEWVVANDPKLYLAAFK